MALGIATDKLHYFNAETGKRISTDSGARYALHTGSISETAL
jgi:hypothetical protein